MSGGRPVQAVILAGGSGTRLRPLSYAVPKPMIPFHGRPFLEYLIELLREQGFERVLLLLGYMPESIIDHFGDGRTWGVDIDYSVTGAEDLTGRRLQVAADRLDSRFLLLYCDNYWPMRFDRMWEAYESEGVPVQVTVYANRDRWSRDCVRVDEDGYVRAFDRSRRAPRLRGVEIGYAIVERDAALPLLPRRQQLFEEAVYPALAAEGRLRAYWTQHRYYSVGGLDRLPVTERFLARHPTVILDRDGVLNERPPRARYVCHPDDFRWLPGALEALAELTRAGWRVIVVSNQAGVNRGELAPAALEAIHRRMCRDAAAAGGRIDGLYVCPHDWDEGCECRKPRPGMLFQAQRDFDLDLTRTLFLGDDERDAEAAAAAGCPFVMISGDVSLLDRTAELLETAAIGGAA